VTPGALLFLPSAFFAPHSVFSEEFLAAGSDKPDFFSGTNADFFDPQISPLFLILFPVPESRELPALRSSLLLSYGLSYAPFLIMIFKHPSPTDSSPPLRKTFCADVFSSRFFPPVPKCDGVRIASKEPLPTVSRLTHFCFSAAIYSISPSSLLSYSLFSDPPPRIFLTLVSVLTKELF